MNFMRNTIGRVLVITGACALLTAGVGNGACVVDEIPACPGQCFEFTLERMLPTPCQNEAGGTYDISFTGSDPDGYYGRVCFNSAAIAPVLEAIDHLQAGDPLADLDPQVVSAPARSTRRCCPASWPTSRCSTEKP